MLLALTGLAALPGAGAAGTPAREVDYRGVRFAAPADWPVYRLNRDSTRCTRFDRSAVYLGHASPRADCPAHAVGHMPSLQVEPLDSAAVRPLELARRTTTLDGQRVRLAPRGQATGTVTAALPELGVLVTVHYGADRGAADRILRSFRSRGARPSRPWTAALSAATRSRRAGAASTPGRSRLAVGQGDGFDTCAAPAAETMATWKQSSPYQAVGVYIGGVNRACAQANLSAAWVQTVENQGWGIIPTYVGRQAPCSGIGQTIDPATAAAQGKQEADDAAAQAAGLGFGDRDPIYFDMEGFPTSDASCVNAVKAFLEAWTKELHAKGWTSGVYGSAGSTGKVLTDANGTGYTEPDDIWYANWDGRDTTSGDPYVRDGAWSNHQRIHQYRGGHDETWGGATINMDSDAVDGAVARAVPPYAYSVQGMQAFSGPRLRKPVDLGAARVGQDAWVKLTVVNAGTQTWQRGGDHPIRLGTWAPQDRRSGFATRDWIAQDRAASLIEGSVAPGGVGTFVAHIRVPAGTTLADEHFNLVAEGVTWLPDQGVNVHVQVLPYAYSLRGVRAFSDRRLRHRVRLSRLHRRQRVWVRVKAFNAGTQPWEPGGANPVRVGTWKPQDRRSRFATKGWVAPNRPVTVSSSTAPGAIGTFVLRLRAPKRTGRYREHFNLVAEGLRWMPYRGLVVNTRVRRR
ncbi:MAG TPA: glycoside hydrolase domain-containing protein [Thermoleophilaceae bacterium]